MQYIFVIFALDSELLEMCSALQLIENRITQ